MSTMTETDTKTVTGICTAVQQKPGNDWVEFHIDGGGKYPVKLATKKQPLIELGKAVGQELATWTYKETDGNPNPHKPGEFYKNRYLEKVEIGGTVPEPEHPSPEKWADANPSPSSRPAVLGGDKDRLIVRQVCIKAASELYASGVHIAAHAKMASAGLIEGDADAATDPVLAVMKAAQRFETWIYRDIDEVPFQ